MSGLPPLPHDLPWDTVARYFAGELSADEAKALVRWMGEEPERRELVERMRELWVEAAGLRQSWDTEAALRKIKRTPREAVGIVPLVVEEGKKLPAARRAITVAMQIAAAVVIVVGGLAVWQAGLFRQAEKEPLTEFTTRRGQLATARFPDGTTVLLGPASALRYAPGFRGRPRTVYLDGQAYFTVTHDQKHPFAVRTAHGVARDLGTRFVVRSYATDSIVDVVVAEGSVSLTSEPDAKTSLSVADSLLLGAGDLGRVTAAGRFAAEHGVVLERYLGWTEGRLVFQETPLRDVAVQLGRWYDLDVQLADSMLGARRLTATFRGEPAAQVLQLIAASLDLRVTQRGKAVSVRAGSRGTQR